MVDSSGYSHDMLVVQVEHTGWTIVSIIVFY